MACRRRRQHSFGGRCERRTPNNVDKLAFKYMMCKVESSTDSDSGTSPRWSDTSTMGCVSSAPECGTLHRMAAQRPAVRPAVRPGCSSLCLDPYDGSSEDSDESVGNAAVTRRMKEQGRGGSGGGRFFGRSRRFSLNHPTTSVFREVLKNSQRDLVTEQPLPQDIQMNCGSESELWVCELDTPTSSKGGCGDLTGRTTDDLTAQAQTVKMQPQLDDSGFLGTTSCTPVGRNASWLLDSSSERSPSPRDLLSLSKRKLVIPGAEGIELGRRKRQCVINMEDEEAGDTVM
ncbi:uncharacterized protein LOC103379487 isoform X2 [Cynoglossus semilaevis]|uniref:uncharacterized protein LOC103379487 isoform X2 n=1 Tax=Cynoglossus semilaevis TaxID=244447 RepID=UPI0007DCB0E6|nr:uncharacterized protein LOC103379487 isoform X2 [Cynoglossus semilaevis]